MNSFELIGFITAVIGVWLTVRQNILCWPVNIISSLFYTLYFFQIKLYADSLLQVFFVVMSIYGWINWNQEKNKTHMIVYNIRWRDLMVLIIIVLIIAIAAGLALKKYTDASLPYLDSFCMSISLAATWLTTRKVLENWLMWMLVDATYVGVYIYKQAYMTAILYVLFVIMAIIGFNTWKKAQKTTMSLK